MSRPWNSLALALVLAAGAVAAPPAVRRVDAKPGQPPVDPTRWHRVGNHIHSSTGIGKFRPKGLKKIFKLAARHHLAMAMITDHNTVEHWFHPLFTTTNGVIPVRGTEWTSDDGHANIIEFEVEGPSDVIVPCDYEHAPAPCGADGIDYADMVEAVHQRGGLVIINHPRLTRHYWPEDTFGADAVEVNGNLSDVSGRKGRAWWHARLAAGQRITAFGGSDWHYWNPIGGNDPEEPSTHCEVEGAVIRAWPKPSFDDAVNLVRMDTPSVEALREAIRAGHVQVLKKPDAPRIYMGADVDGDGTYGEVRAGDTIESGEGPVRVQIRVMGGEGEELQVAVSRGLPGGQRVESVQEFELESQDEVVALELIRGAPGSSFVRAEIGSKGKTVGNPIFF
jgi:hypothetical protein